MSNKSIAQHVAEIVREPALGRRRMMIAQVPEHQRNQVMRGVHMMWESERAARIAEMKRRGEMI